MKAFLASALGIIGICTLFPSTTQADDTAVEMAKEDAKAVASSRQPAEQISLDLWIVTLGNDDEDADGEELDRLIARASNLPTVIGRLDDVRALLNRLTERKAIRAIQEYRLTTLDRSLTNVLCGERVPQITGVTLSDRGRTNNIMLQQVGTAVELTPMIGDDDMIRVRVSIEKSGLEQSHDVTIAVPSKGKAVYASKVTSASVKTSVSLESGGAVLVAQITDSKKVKSELVILSATVVQPKPAARDEQALAPGD